MTLILIIAVLSGWFGHVLSVRLQRKPPTMHTRGQPQFSKDRCDAWWCTTNAMWMDGNGLQWCAQHVRGTGHVEACVDGTWNKDGRCLTHDMDCPKPWACWTGKEGKP